MQQLLPDVSPLVNILQKAGQEKRDKAELQDAVNHAMFMDAPDNDSFMALIGQQMNQGLIDAEEAMMYEQLAAMPIEQRNKSIARDLISGGFQDLVFDKGLTGQQTRNMGKSYSPDVVYKPTGEKDKDGNPINQAFYAFSGVDANGEPYVKYQQIEGELGGSYGRSADDEIEMARIRADINSQAKGNDVRSVVDAQTDTSTQVAKNQAEVTEAVETAKQNAIIAAASKKKQEEGLGVTRAKIKDDEIKKYRDARSKKLPLQQLERALEAASTGRYAQAKTFIGKYLPLVDIDSEQNLGSILTQYALDELRTQTGPKTDFDFVKAAETQVQAKNTKGANKLILERLKINQDYAEKRYKAWDKHIKSGKNAEDFTFNYTDSNIGSDVKSMSNDELFQ